MTASDPHIAERKCIATGEVQPKFGMIRFAIGPDGQLFPDVMEKLPGRGIWVSADRAALAQAAQKNLFSRSAKTPVTGVDEAVAMVGPLLARRVTDLISLARRSGSAVAGYEKVKDWLMKDVAEVLIQSSDGSERGKSKLSTPHYGSFIGWLTSEELGAAFGRQTVIHCALASGGLCASIVSEANRLRGLRGFEDGKARRHKTEKTDGGHGLRKGK